MDENLTPIPEPIPDYTARGRELVFCGMTVLLSILMCNFVFYGGFNLGFALSAVGSISCAWAYIKTSGGKFTRYENTLLALSLVIAAGFGRSSDAAVKVFMVLFLFVAVNLALILAAGHNRRSPQGAMSLLDAPRAFYRLGIGNMGKTGQGLVAGFRRGGTAARRIGAVGTGLLISVPILVILVSLLTDADAAFEGLMDLLPEFDPEEYLTSAFWGILLGWVLYSRGLSLHKAPKPTAAQPTGKGMNPLTVNTVLCMVCLVYAAYLASQLAYICGGLSGILPEEFTMAEYARRGFFEMAWLCELNLGILCLSIWLIRPGDQLPRLTKMAGAFIAAITLFLIITASAKMFLYIGSYGLTWSRVMTEVIMLWLAVTTVLVTVRLFLPKFGYMKAVVLTAMILGALVTWADVESLVARYNVNAYRSGALETVDVRHLGNLGPAGIPWLLELTEDADPEVAEKARNTLKNQPQYKVEDFREWNGNKARAARLLEEYRTQEDLRTRELLKEKLGLELELGTVVQDWNHTPDLTGGRRFLRIKITEDEEAAMLAQLQSSGWNPFPYLGKDRVPFIVVNQLFTDFSHAYSLGEKTEGYWLFLDLHPDAQTISNIHGREGYRFILACYSANRNEFYFFEADDLAAAPACGM